MFGWMTFEACCAEHQYSLRVGDVSLCCVGVSARPFALLALAFLAACNTYNESLLGGALDHAPAAVDAGNGGNAGESHAAAGSDEHGGKAGVGGAHGAEAGTAGEPAAHAGESNTSGGSGIGGSAGVAGSPSAAGSPNNAGSAGTAGTGSGLVGDQIDDFEDQDIFILRLSMRNGPWYGVKDATASGTVGPTMTIAALASADLRPGGTGTAALHLTASGFADWGAGVGADMVNQMGKKAAYDVSAYRAIRFYAKIGSGSTSSVKVLLPNVYSDADGGKCSDLDSTKRCGDHLFKSVSGLTTTWAQYEVKFAELTQQAFGLPQTSLDPTGVYSVQFTLANKLPIDLWIDDVTFVPK
jgi:hypothetical protein